VIPLQGWWLAGYVVVSFLLIAFALWAIRRLTRDEYDPTMHNAESNMDEFKKGNRYHSGMD
jgi:hypothetical protein